MNYNRVIVSVVTFVYLECGSFGFLDVYVVFSTSLLFGRKRVCKRLNVSDSFSNLLSRKKF